MLHTALCNRSGRLRRRVAYHYLARDLPGGPVGIDTPPNFCRYALWEIAVVLNCNKEKKKKRKSLSETGISLTSCLHFVFNKNNLLQPLTHRGDDSTRQHVYTLWLDYRVPLHPPLWHTLSLCVFICVCVCVHLSTELNDKTIYPQSSVTRPFIHRTMSLFDELCDTLVHTLNEWMDQSVFLPPPKRLMDLLCNMSKWSDFASKVLYVKYLSFCIPTPLCVCVFWIRVARAGQTDGDALGLCLL